MSLLAAAHRRNAGGGSPIPEILWWKLNEGSGTAVTGDGSNGGDDGTTDAAWVTGKSGSGFALDFNGTSQDAATTASLAYTSIDTITLTGWINADTLGTGTYVLFESSANYNNNNDTFIVYIDGSTTPKRLTMGLRGAAQTLLDYCAVFASGSWVFLAVVIERNYARGGSKYGRHRVWFDSVEQTLTNSANNIDTTAATFATQRLFVGARNSGSLFYPGLMDDIRVYSGDKSADLASIQADPQ